MTDITTLRPGEHFMFKGFEWVCLDPNHPDGGVLAIMAKPWAKDVKFCPSDKFADEKGNWNNYRTSNVRGFYLIWRTVFSIKKVCCHIPLTLLPTTATELMALFMTMFLFYLVMSTESTVTTSRTTTVLCGLSRLGVAVTRIPTRATLTTFASCTPRGS